MNKQNEYQQDMNYLIHQFERAHTYALTDELDKYRSSVLKLLDNGRPIYEQATGGRMYELYVQRCKLWSKIQTIDHCIALLHNTTN